MQQLQWDVFDRAPLWCSRNQGITVMQQESRNLGRYAAVERMHVKHMPHRHRLIGTQALTYNVHEHVGINLYLKPFGMHSFVFVSRNFRSILEDITCNQALP